jgi:hypothetical protein
MRGCHAINDSYLQKAQTPPKERRDAITQNGLSFLRIVDEGAINCKRCAPFLIVYFSTARQLFNTGSMQHSGWFKRSKQTQLFADADTIISVHRVFCDVYQSRLMGVQRSCKLATYERPVICPHVRGTGPAACKIESAQQQVKQLA